MLHSNATSAGNGLKAATRILGAVAWALLAGCTTGAGGPPNDAGVLSVAVWDGGTSVGTATLSGAATGTVPVTASVEYGPDVGFNPPDGGWALAFFVFPTDQPGEPLFSCAGWLPGSTLDAGSFTPPVLDNFQYLNCSFSTGSNLSFEVWPVVTAFEFNVSSPGPAYTVGGYTVWPYPSGTLTLAAAPYAEPGITYGDAGVNVTFGPPPD